VNIDKIKERFIPMSETMFYILLSLCKERHGYGIMQHVRELTRGRVVLGAGTIYQSLQKLEANKLIEPVKEEDRRKYYLITKNGKEILLLEAARIKELYKNLEGLI